MIREIPIVMASDENYFIPMAVAIESLLFNADPDTKYQLVLLLTGEFAMEKKQRIDHLVKNYNMPSVMYINMHDRFQKVKSQIEHITSPTFYRLEIPSLLSSYDKCIYLDVDMVINGDLTDIYNTDMGECYIAGVKAAAYYHPENKKEKLRTILDLPEFDQYVNAGMLVMNLKTMREDGLEKRFFELIEKNFPNNDQDILNCACYGRILMLPPKYNCMTKYRLLEENSYESMPCISLCFEREEWEEACQSPVIIHYADKWKPWENLSVDFAEVWWKYAKKMNIEHEVFDYFFNGMLDKQKAQKCMLEEQLKEVSSQRNDNKQQVVELKKHIKNIWAETDERIKRLRDEKEILFRRIDELNKEIKKYKKEKNQYEKEIVELKKRVKIQMNEVKISIIIPIYNMEKYLQECLDTVVTQTLKEIEIICINDGSSDRSEEIIKSNAEKDARIVLLSQENQGVARARNNGLNIAKGKYVVFMDPDDWYPSDDTLEVLYNTAERENVLICGGSFSEQTGDTLVTEFTGAKAKYKFKEDGLVEYKDYQFDYGYHRFVYNLNFLKENDIYFPEYIRFQDPPFFVKAMTLAKVFYAMERVTYKYRVAAQKILWTNNKLLHLMYGLRDNLCISGKNELEMLHKTTLKRIGGTYLSWYEDRIDTLPFEIIDAFLDVCSYINASMIADSKEYLTYRKDIFAFVKTMFFIRKDEWNLSDNEIKEYENRINELAKEIYDEDELSEVVSGKAQFAIRTNEKRKHIEEIKDLKQIIKGETMGEPLVSVVVPVYNVSLYLAECLESVLNQTLQEIEIICVNDGSTDDSLQILLEYAEKDKRISIYEHENSGLSATRNAGVRQATGKYIYFMDSDDILEVRALELLYGKAEKDKLDVIYFDGSSFSDSSACDEQVKKFKDYYTRKHTYEKDVYTGSDLMREMLESDEYRTSACLQMIRREFFVEKKLWFIQGLIHEDNIFTFCCMLSAQRAGYLKESLFNRRIRENSIMTANTTFEHVYGYFRGYLIMSDFLKKVCITPKEEIAIVKMMYQVLDNARGGFSRLSSEEKYSMIGLMPYERMLFRSYVSDFDKLRTEKLELNKKLQSTYKQSTKRAKRINKLKKEKSKILKSTNYRLGKFLLIVPRKVKKLLKRLLGR